MAGYTCTYCGEEFATTDERERHRLGAHPAGGGDSLTADFGTVIDTRDIEDASQVDDTGKVEDTGSVRGLDGTSPSTNADGRREIDVGEWLAGANDSVPSRGRGSELTA